MKDMNHRMGYDKTDPRSIEAYSQRMIGKSFREILAEDKIGQTAIFYEDDTRYGSSDTGEKKRNKGNLGQMIEERFFHYPRNNDPGPDFREAGVELKVSPYRENRNGSLSAKERLILTMIDYFEVVNEEFEESHLWKKSKLILLVYYQYMKGIQYNLDYKIRYSKLFTPPEQDLKVIQHDYYIIVSKIRAGRAHELSEGDTLYLGAAPKSATSKDRRTQPFSDEPAKPRAFAFKTSYMTYVLNTYIVPGKNTYEPIIRNGSVYSLEDHVREKIERYREYPAEDLCKIFGINIFRYPKNLGALIAYRILGIKGDHAEEFEKANVVVKTIRIEKNGRIKESMSFPAFRFKELVQEEWEDSTFGNYLRETRFLFVVYKFDENDVLRLRGCQFWNIPYDDLEVEVRSVWERTKKILQEGLRVEVVNGRNRNNLPKAAENRVSHVRPHSRNANDTYELPDGRFYPKQCFWLNNTYILSQIEKDLL